MPKINDAMAFTEEDSGVIGVVIPFEQRGTGEPAEIVWVYNPETGATVVTLANSWWDCFWCGVGIVACAACAIPCAAGLNPACITCIALTCPSTLAVCCVCGGCPDPCPKELCAKTVTWTFSGTLSSSLFSVKKQGI